MGLKVESGGEDNELLGKAVTVRTWEVSGGKVLFKLLVVAEANYCQLIISETE